jgi:hypothetical protein
LYRDYPLSEGALVAETCNLIQANRGPNEVLLCEQQYNRLMPPATWPDTLGPRARADLIVTRDLTPKQAAEIRNLSPYLAAAIEVKRASAPQAQVNQDLLRLATCKRANPNAQTLLFVVAEAHRPEQFVTPEGRAILGKHPIFNANAHYRVRRACKAAAAFTCKAAAAFSGKESAHYACIIEVFNDR